MSFGVKRFMAALQRSSGEGCAHLLRGVLQEMRVWQGNGRTRDDLMMLAFSLAKY
jgi:hypothetical protein